MSRFLSLACGFFALYALTAQRGLGWGDSAEFQDWVLNHAVFTMVNSVARLTTDVIEEVRGHFGEKVYETVIPRNVRVSEAPSMGTPVVFLDPRSKGAEAYKAFAWEFMAKNPTRFAAPPAGPIAEPVAASAPEEPPIVAPPESVS